MIETRIVFELRDILTMRIVCQKCEREVVQNVDKSITDLPHQCPWCHWEWYQSEHDIGLINTLLTVLAQFPTLKHNRICVKLELDKDALNPVAD